MAFNGFSQALNSSLAIPAQFDLAGGSQQTPSQLPFQQIHPMQQMQMQQIQQMHLMHPALNDQPLEFNPSKNQPSMTVVTTSDDSNDSKRNGSDETDRRDRDRDRNRLLRERRRDREKDRKDKKDNEDGPIKQPTLPAMPMMGMMPMMGGMMTPNMMPMMDPNMMTMGQFSVMPGLMAAGEMILDPTSAPASANGAVFAGTAPPAGPRPVLEFKSCTLTPPAPGAPPPPSRERPLGCKTVYVGGLPDNITEEIVREVFGRCGEMLSVRLSKRNFCHIRFENEMSVEAALLYSGYRMRIGNATDAPNTGRLHVDYAQARIDQYEYECRQRAAQREARHRERIERDRLRPQSPPPVQHYTDHEAAVVADSIKNDEGFKKCIHTVVTWLERGDLNKRNANTFYSIIQSTYSHVRRLLNEKMQCEEELQAAKDQHRNHVQNIVLQFGLIEKVFNSASHKKCWDHFTKAQRKNIEAWKKQSTELKQLQLSERINEEADEEMDVSDNDDSEPSAKKRNRLDKESELNALKDENDGLKCQLEGYKNEVELVRGELTAELAMKERQITILQQTVQNLQTELSEQRSKLQNEESQVKKLSNKLKTLEAADMEEKEVKNEKKETTEDSGNSAAVIKMESDALLIGLISTFLHVHPFGAGLDYIWSYLTKMSPSLKPADVEALMTRYPQVFKQELSGVGAGMERKWIFIGFQSTF